MTPTLKDAYKHIAPLPGRVKAVMAGVVAAGIAALGFFSAGGSNSPALAAPAFPNSVSAPAGYQVTYAHDFTTQGMGDWVTQPGLVPPRRSAPATGSGLGSPGGPVG